MSDVVLHGDCLNAFAGVVPGTVDLIYLDPPFFTQRTHVLRTRDNRDEFSFSDVWPTLDAYLEYMQSRLSVLSGLLNPNGSVVVHCDAEISHHLRHILDNIFGRENFRDEIVWFYKRWSNTDRGLLNNHQKLLFYSKTHAYKFNVKRERYSLTTNIDQILQLRSRDERNKSVYAVGENGEVLHGNRKEGVPLSNVWEIPYLNPKAKERVGFPTQKPLLLLERVIELLTDPGDLVLDPFCGSGTTLVAAKLLERTFIGSDKNEKAVDLTNRRLAQLKRTESRLLRIGKHAYDTHSDDIKLFLRLLGATPVYRNRGIDGFVWNESHSLVAIRVQREGEAISEVAAWLSAASAKKKAHRAVLVRTQANDEQPPLLSHPQKSAVIVIDHPCLMLSLLNTFERLQETNIAI